MLFCFTFLFFILQECQLKDEEVCLWGVGVVLLGLLCGISGLPIVLQLDIAGASITLQK